MAEKRNIRSEASSSGSGGVGSTSGGGGAGSGRGESVVIDFGRRRSSCGYCRSGAHTSISHGLLVHSLTVDDYQALLDRGWRRSGCFVYKPEMERTCCPSYTIRLKASDFVPSKEQIRVSKRMQRFLDGMWDGKKSDELIDATKTSKESCSQAHKENPTLAREEILASNLNDKNKDEQYMHYLSELIDNAVGSCIENGELPSDVQLPKASVKKVSQSKRKLLVEGAEDLLYSSNICFQIAAALRRTQKDVRHLHLSNNVAGENEQSSELTPKMVAEKLASCLNHSMKTSCFSIRACNGHINFYSASKQALYETTEEVAVSQESSKRSGSKGICSRNTGRPQGERRRLEIRLNRSCFDPDEFALYQKYQLIVHNDTPDHVTESSYRRFLVDTPLVFVPPTGDGTVPPCGFGSFHQQYVIDGQLVAVGVIDILPKCLSSKYLFWDPDFAFLSLGKYSALQEISCVRENQLHCPSLQYYYLGYYIHSCSKMRYKAAYRPSELLCPLRYQWVPFDIAKPVLDRKPYVVLSDIATSQNGELSTPSSMFENNMDLQHDEDSNDVPMDVDEEMTEFDYDESDDESSPETSDSGLVEEGVDLGNILIGLKGSRLRYKDLQPAFGTNGRRYLDSQLHHYTRVVGADLATRMVYSLG